MNNAVLCVDIGTSSLKAAYISFKGEVFAFARIEQKILKMKENCQKSRQEVFLETVQVLQIHLALCFGMKA